MDPFTTPDGALRLAITALLAVVGYRLARPSRGADWLPLLAYAAALGAVLVAGLAGGGAGAAEAPVAQRLLGAAALVGGLLLAGAPLRASRPALPPRGAAGGPPARPASPAPIAPAPRQRPLVHAGLALVLAGQVLRAPTPAGAAAAAAAALVLGATAWAAARRA